MCTLLLCNSVHNSTCMCVHVCACVQQCTHAQCAHIHPPYAGEYTRVRLYMVPLPPSQIVINFYVFKNTTPLTKRDQNSHFQRPSGPIGPGKTRLKNFWDFCDFSKGGVQQSSKSDYTELHSGRAQQICQSPANLAEPSKEDKAWKSTIIKISRM